MAATQTLSDLLSASYFTTSDFVTLLSTMQHCMNIVCLQCGGVITASSTVPLLRQVREHTKRIPCLHPTPWETYVENDVASFLRTHASGANLAPMRASFALQSHADTLSGAGDLIVVSLLLCPFCLNASTPNNGCWRVCTSCRPRSLGMGPCAISVSGLVRANARHSPLVIGSVASLVPEAAAVLLVSELRRRSSAAAAAAAAAPPPRASAHRLISDGSSSSSSAPPLAPELDAVTLLVTPLAYMNPRPANAVSPQDQISRRGVSCVISPLNPLKLARLEVTADHRNTFMELAFRTRNAPAGISRITAPGEAVSIIFFSERSMADLDSNTNLRTICYPVTPVKMPLDLLIRKVFHEYFYMINAMMRQLPMHLASIIANMPGASFGQRGESSNYSLNDVHRQTIDSYFGAIGSFIGILIKVEFKGNGVMAHFLDVVQGALDDARNVDEIPTQPLVTAMHELIYYMAKLSNTDPEADKVLFAIRCLVLRLKSTRFVGGGVAAGDDDSDSEDEDDVVVPPSSGVSRSDATLECVSANAAMRVLAAVRLLHMQAIAFECVILSQDPDITRMLLAGFRADAPTSARRPGASAFGSSGAMPSFSPRAAASPPAAAPTAAPGPQRLSERTLFENVDWSTWWGHDMRSWPPSRIRRVTVSWFYCAVIMEAMHGFQAPYVTTKEFARSSFDRNAGVRPMDLISVRDAWGSFVHAASAYLRANPGDIPRAPLGFHWTEGEQNRVFDSFDHTVTATAQALLLHVGVERAEV